MSFSLSSDSATYNPRSHRNRRETQFAGLSYLSRLDYCNLIISNRLQYFLVALLLYYWVNKQKESKRSNLNCLISMRCASGAMQCNESDYFHWVCLYHTVCVCVFCFAVADLCVNWRAHRVISISFPRLISFSHHILLVFFVSVCKQKDAARKCGGCVGQRCGDACG